MGNIVSFFYPNFCYGCGKKGEVICKKCLIQYGKVPDVHICHVCERECTFGFVHTECKERTNLDGLLYVSLYTPIIKDIIANGKYNFLYSHFLDLGKIMSQFYCYYSFSPGAVFIPVPTYIFKKRKRGFNQAQILANSLNKKAGKKVLDILIKKKLSHSQAGLGKYQRLENLVDSFILRKNIQVPESVIIVDDVFTTGATLEECAKILKNNGVKDVFGFTFAKAGNRARV